MTLTRRALMAGLAGMAGVSTGLAWPATASALPARALRFPRDYGAHPDLRTEWWYITGHAQSVGTNPVQPPREFGFQLTFFRTRVDVAQGLTSRFAARQLVFAHAALTDVAGGKLWHDQRIAREGFGLALASTEDTDLRLSDWTLRREPVSAPASGQAPGLDPASHNASLYSANLSASDFALQLQFKTRQPLILQGRQGLSRKGPEARQASYYYSEPQLQTSGRIVLRGQSFEVTGTGWLDHEWSEELLHPEAKGWDWIGMNLDDGSALTAFQLRNAAGGAVWDGGSFRAAGGMLRTFSRGEVSFKPVRFWKSPLTQANYPVEWLVNTPAGRYTVQAVIDNQELDSRSSTGAVYWEGLSELLDSRGQRVGRGYLELTGYAAPLRL